MLRLFSSKVNVAHVGVDFMPTGVAVVEVSSANQDKGRIRQSNFLPAVGQKDQSLTLQQWVSHNGLKKMPCISLIAKHDVQLFQLEKPAVSDEELMQAVSWKIKDLVNFDVESAVVDVFQLPPSPKSPLRLINAVVANESVAGSYVDSINQAGLDLQAIDVHELVARNFRHIYDFTEQTIAILQFSDNESLMTIYHDQDLYVAREFKIGQLDMDNAMDEAESLYESLLLELQRSMDYFESTYGIGLVQKMLLFPQTSTTERMAKYIQNYVSYELDFAEVNVDNKGQTEQIDTHCFAAYCAALRGVYS